MIEQTPCPHCYSEKFKVDFESIFNRKNQIGRGVASSRKISEDETSAMTKSVRSDRSASSEDSVKLSNKSRKYIEERRMMRSSSIARFTKTVQEQKVAQFDLAFANEGVTLDNFTKL